MLCINVCFIWTNVDGGYMKLSQNNLVDLLCLSNGNTDNNVKLEQKNTRPESYKLVYVFGGKGKIYIDEKCFPISKGDSFAVFPYSHFFVSGSDDLKYVWLEFSGVKGAMLMARTAFSKKTPVLGKIDIINFEDLFDFPELTGAPYVMYRIGGGLIMIMSYYMEKFPGKALESEGYVLRACQVIEENCCNYHFGVKDVAEALKIDRSYLYRMFMDEMGVSVMDYITRRRISRAEAMLLNSDTPIKDVALSVGYMDQMYFSRVFKKQNGRTPTEFRRAISR